jgi:hypothetical protein
MPADVVIRLHRSRSVAENDHALAAAVLEREVIAGIRDAALVVDHEPQVIADEPFIGEIVLLVDVILGRNRVALGPSARIGYGRCLEAAGRVLQRFVDAAPGDVAAAVAEALRGRSDPAARDRSLLSGSRSRYGRGTLRRGRLGEQRARKRDSRGARSHRGSRKVAAAHFLAHPTLREKSAARSRTSALLNQALSVKLPRAQPGSQASSE